MPRPKIKVAPLTEADINAVAELQVFANGPVGDHWQEFFSDVSTFTARSLRAHAVDLASTLELDEAQVLVARSAEGVVGFVDYEVADYGRINSLFVRPETRRLGAGRELMRTALLDLSVRAVPYVELTIVNRPGSPADHLYASLGFVQTEQERQERILRVELTTTRIDLLEGTQSHNGPGAL